VQAGLGDNVLELLNRHEDGHHALAVHLHARQHLREQLLASARELGGD
jgi:hypothetical protein